VTAITAAATGLWPLYRRRLAVSAKTVAGIVGWLVAPMLWILVVGPALDSALGGFDPRVDYYSYISVGQATFLIPFVSIASGINVIVDRQYGVMRELLVAPIRRATIPLANALGVLTIALVQLGIILVLAVARGADFHTSAAGVGWFVAAAVLLSLGTYGVAEILALTISSQEGYGPLIAAVGVTPWFLSGALYPLAVLPAGVRSAAYMLPWTHSVALMRYGLMRGTDSGLGSIWGMQSQTAMAALSLAALAVFAGATLTLALRVFDHTATS
jgi:ABC-2 type transport system permease protein